MTPERPDSSARPLRRTAVLHALVLSLSCLALPAVHAAPDARASRFHEDALQRYERNDIGGAIVQLKNALQIDRGMLPVQVLLGKALLANGEAVAAEVALLEARRLGVDRAEIVVPLARTFVAQGKQKRILDDAQFSPAGLPTPVQVSLWLLRSAAAADLGDLRGALKSIDEARAIDARSPDVWFAEVPVRIRARQLREAMSAAERGLALGPGLAEAWYQKGSVFHVQGDLRAALGAYDRAVGLETAHLEARIARAGLYVDLARPTDALLELAEIRRRSPREPRAAYLRAVLAERDDPAAARAALSEVTALIDPVPLDFIRFRPQLLMLNGLAHFALNETEKAKPYLENFQKLQGATPVSKLLARIYLAEPNLNRAVEILEGYVKLQPTDAQALTLLGAAYMAQGRNSKATAMLQDALRGKDNADMRAVLGLSLIGAGPAGTAVEQLELAFRKDPRQTQAATALIGLHLQAGRPAKALVVAEALVTQQPANAGALNLLGMARARSGNVDGARQAFETALKRDTALTAAALNLARLDIGAKAFDAADTRLNAVLGADERNVDALLELAHLAELRGGPNDSLRWLAKANDQAGPRELRPGLALVDAHLRAGRAGPALEVAKALSAKAPDDLAVLLAYSRAQLANGALPPARATLTNATRLADFDAPRQIEIARLQLQAGNPTGATYSLDKALSASPESVSAMALLTELELRQGDTGAAERRARRIIEQNPRLAIGHALLAQVALARGQQAGAVESLRRAHQIEPGTPTVVALLRTLSRQDGGKAGFALAEHWLKTHPQDLTVRSALADGYARAGNDAAAQTNYEAVLRSAPDDSQVLNNLANIMLRRNDPGAVKLAQRSVAKDPNNANAIDTLGWALFQSGDVDRALQFLRDARLRDPANPEIRFHLASALARTGRSNEAREELTTALKSGRSFGEATQAAELLKSLN